MFALTFRFPAERYHATPWGRSTNEADVAWPPEPARILRSLIATWWRKADHQAFPHAGLADVIDALAAELPVYHLPDAVHSHVAAFMPAPPSRTLIYDAFLRFDSSATVTVAWPGIELTEPQIELCRHLVPRLGYLGRAESWAEAEVLTQWGGRANCGPLTDEHSNNSPVVAVDVVVAVTPAQWSAVTAGKVAGAASLPPRKRAALLATIPARLCDALAIDSTVWTKAGWSSPAAMRTVVYQRPPVGPSGTAVRHATSRTRERRAEVARFVLAGRPAPRIEDALRIGEITRLALMARGSGSVPPELVGRDEHGLPQRNDAAHAHAFFIPEDSDGDGKIDYLIVFCRHGFSPGARTRLDRLTRLWLAHGRADEEGERGQKEWRVALEDIAPPEAFSGDSALLCRSTAWESVTPYLRPWYSKKGFGLKGQIERELSYRLPGVAPPVISELDPPPKRAVTFHRIRSGPRRRGLTQPDVLGTFVRLEFLEPVQGPIALGFGCHYGLGVFAAVGAKPALPG